MENVAREMVFLTAQHAGMPEDWACMHCLPRRKLPSKIFWLQSPIENMMSLQSKTYLAKYFSRLLKSRMYQ